MAAGVLVDTSVWVRFFRHGPASEALHLDGLLQARAVCTCPPIRAEILSGALTERERATLREQLKAIEILALPPDVWDTIAEARFTLARHGHQAALVDLLIAATAVAHHAPLWTLDDDFVAIRRALPFPRYLPDA